MEPRDNDFPLFWDVWGFSWKTQSLGESGRIDFKVASHKAGTWVPRYVGLTTGLCECPLAMVLASQAGGPRGHVGSGDVFYDI